ncbi:acyl-CoA dehydrogenase/oxidase [Thamnocephalis sphaerospora]|uniref:Acyl-coenzyme A oxidase n=1 Tax=Thamnocephalis sphaerospora TaxID=78915 RepID=A0A4P9XN50_9FUNG|nr:acyl-CoA dehydrogenase/oxidase [Thamnocephalis sphaerospora]|eukprot:RKP06831.1 acyl-CoA dehydrogenase/oxidase [Thamnocephalis sphaerospora]
MSQVQSNANKPSDAGPCSLATLPTEFPSAAGDRTARDLEAARLRCSFPTAQLTELLYGAETLRMRQRVLEVLEAEPLFSRADRYYCSYEEQVCRGLAWAKRIVELRDQHGWDDAEFSCAMALLDEYIPIYLHYLMVLPVLRTQCTPEQQERWLQPASDFRIIACYAQTELAHGSDLSGLETTATYDKVTDEFIIDSNGFTGAKWWIGGLGAMATHAVLQVRLILHGRDYGPHLFFVPIRSLETHEALPGITLGSIGPKVFATTNLLDNGFVHFSGYRVPRDCMLMRFARVEKGGAYVKPPHPKLSYAVMMYTRSSIARNTGWGLARQFTESKTGDEASVLSYPMVYHRLLPLVAQSHAILAAADQMELLLQRFGEEVQRGNLSDLAEVHATTCCLKSSSVWLCANGIEEARRALGGHGYSAYGGYGHMFGNYASGNTIEARFLIKCVDAADAGKSLPITVQYLAQHRDYACAVASKEDWLRTSEQLKLLGCRAAHRATILAAEHRAGRVWSDLNILCWQMSVAHGDWLLATSLHTRARDYAQKQPEIGQVFKRVADLFCLHTVTQHLADYLELGIMSPIQARLLRQQLDVVLQDLLPDAVGLVDAFALPDYLLDSVLGRNDGRVYHAIWEAAANSPPINTTAVCNGTKPALPFGYKEYIQPMRQRPVANRQAKL